MTKKGVLILGGTGFVGRSLIQRLLSINENVYVIANTAHSLPNLTNLHSFSDSLDNEERLRQILPFCHTVFHLASCSVPGSSKIQPTYEISNNLLPTLKFLDILHSFKDIELIYFSSGGAIYGNPISLSTSELPVTEDCATYPLSYYGAGKAAMEKFIIAFCQQSQHHATILRPSNFYGPMQVYKQGFGIIPTILHHIKTKKIITIWGDGTNIRDYLYIDDTIDLCLKLITPSEKIKEKKVGVDIYNIGSGIGTSLNDLCQTIEEISGCKIKRQYLPSRSVDVKSIILDSTKLQKNYHWVPKTNLKTGLYKTWMWFNKQYQ